MFWSIQCTFLLLGLFYFIFSFIFPGHLTIHLPIILNAGEIRLAINNGFGISDQIEGDFQIPQIACLSYAYSPEVFC